MGLQPLLTPITLDTMLTYSRLVMSDWGGTNSIIESVEAGCDIEMPFSNQWRGQKLIQAVWDGRLSREAIQKAATNVLYMVERTKGGDMSEEPPEREEDKLETRQLIKEAGIQGLTLLKNDGGLLPIKSSQKKIAVIGPNSNRAVAGGGGSASLNPYYSTIPLDSIRKVPGKDVSYALGCHTYKLLPLAAEYCTTASGEQGVSLEFHVGDQFEGAPAVIQTRTNTDLYLWFVRVSLLPRIPLCSYHNSECPGLTIALGIQFRLKWAMSGLSESRPCSHQSRVVCIHSAFHPLGLDGSSWTEQWR
jgi:beta-glucosidase